MTSVNNNQKFYQFLQMQEDWQTQADTNGDGAITKTEFRKFLEANNFDFSALDGWNGEKATKSENDLINKFWASINTNTSKTKIKGTKVRNSAALDEKEQAAVLKKLEASEKVSAFVSNLEAPSFISNADGWRQEVAEQLMVKVEKDFIKKDRDISELEAFLEEISQKVEAKATANYYAAECRADATGGKLEGYYYPLDDKTLQSILDNYINKLPADANSETIEADIKNIINTYLATAGLASGNYNLASLGYNPKENAKLNDLQSAVVAQKLDKQINSSIDKFISDTFGSITMTKEEKEAFKNSLLETLAPVEEEFISGLTQADMKDIDSKIKSFDVASYVNESSKTDVFVKFYESSLDTILDTFADQVLSGINASNRNSCILDVYKNNEDIKLDRETLDSFLADVKEAGQRFIKARVESGENTSNIVNELKTFLSNYVKGEGVQEIKTNLSKAADEFGYVSKDELPAYKDKVKSYVAELIPYVSPLKLGSKTIDVNNYKSVIDAYTDGSKLVADVKTMLDSIGEQNSIYTYTKKSADKNTKGAASVLSDLVTNIKDNNLNTIICGHGEIHTEFGMNSGNIVFEQNDTTQVYNMLVKKTAEEFNKTEEGKAALEQLGGEAALKKLVQAAWIMTYNDFDSSKSNSSAAFISKVLDNLESMLKKLETNPEYLSIFTEHTAYANSELTTGLTHYGTNTTVGNDQKISYADGCEEIDGVVHLKNKTDDPDYQTTMSELLKKLKSKYSSISPDVITKVFVEAQKQAIQAVHDNKNDCPYGTTASQTSFWGIHVTLSNMDNATAGVDWAGTSRSGDHFVISMGALVQMTLYYFDKLLYKELVG